MKRVVATGTFDGVHEGHKFFLSEAKKLGDWLGVVVALDSTVENVKKRSPNHNQNTRQKNVSALGIADSVLLGNEGDKYAIIEALKPDIIALGYDQIAFTEKLREQLAERGLNVDIVRIPAFHPEKYKSSLINKTPPSTPSLA